MNITNNTCAACLHFILYDGEGTNRGACFFNPPVPLSSGACMRPTMRQSERACGQFAERDAATPQEKNQKWVTTQGKKSHR